MYPQTHFLFSLLVAFIFAKLGIFSYKTALFVALFAVLIDIDHFINFIIKRKDCNFKNAWNNMVIKKFYGRTFIHHYTGFMIISLLIFFLFFTNRELFWIISLGYYTHLLLDIKINALAIKEKLTIKLFGFTEKISKLELLFDAFLLIGIALLWL